MIPAFFIDRDAKFTMLFSHGNAEDLGMIIQYFREVSHILEVNIFSYEYSGYGMSTGEPSEQGLYLVISVNPISSASAGRLVFMSGSVSAVALLPLRFFERTLGVGLQGRRGWEVDISQISFETNGVLCSLMLCAVK